ncbi:MAG: hypothetical protein QM692_10225 [Thermomicrobiales bacterium]
MRGVVLAVGLLIALAIQLVSAQPRSEADFYKLLRGNPVAHRVFESTEQWSSGEPVRWLSFTVWEFPSVASASQAADVLVQVLPQLLADMDWPDGLAPDPVAISAPNMGDRSAAFLVRFLNEQDNSSTEDFWQLTVTFAVVQEERFLYAIFGGDATISVLPGDEDAILNDILYVTERILPMRESASARPLPTVHYNTGGVWDRLPRLEDLPQGYSFEGDAVEEETVQKTPTPVAREDSRVFVTATPRSQEAGPPTPDTYATPTASRTVLATPVTTSERTFMVDVVAALRSQGVSVVIPDNVFAPVGVFSVPGQGIRVNGAIALVYFFPSAEAAHLDLVKADIDDVELSGKLSGESLPGQRKAVQGGDVIVVLIGGDEDTQQKVRDAIVNLP